MLKNINRVKKQRDFKIIYQQGNIFFNNYMVLKVLKNKQLNPRFAIVISAKLAKANQRNQLKRKISEFLRINLSHINHQNDIIFIIKKPSSEWLQPTEEVKKLLKKANLWTSDVDK